ncbi:MFS transporter [Polymorphospora rubra]|uniref:MFS transporter n=1 Tax=Polymorphospora rubra TaxID=338584 RepID=UPI001BB4328A|nr:MFS transporter [Polymorphospora rubra]
MAARRRPWSRTPGHGLGSLVTAHGVGVIGTQITALALPTLAIIHLGASPFAASVLFALEFGAQAFAAPVLGVLVDRARSPRRLLILASLGYGLAVLLVPVAAVGGLLSLVLLGAVAVVTGVLGGLITIGLQAVVPVLVPRDRLVAANSAMAGARSVGQVAGPAIAGSLVQWWGAAAAMGVDAATRVLSILAFATMRPSREALARRSAEASGMVRALRDGVAVLRGQPLLVRIAVTAAALNFGGSALGALYLVFAYQELHLSPGLIGVVYVVNSVASLVAVGTAGRVIRRLRMTRVVPFFAPLAGAALFLIPAAAIAPPFAALVAYEAVFGYCATVWFIATATLQQSLVPTHQLGRVIAMSRTISALAIPVGALLGGALAQWWGMVPTLLAFAAAALAGTCASIVRNSQFGTTTPTSADDRPAESGTNAPSSEVLLTAEPTSPKAGSSS